MKKLALFSLFFCLFFPIYVLAMQPPADDEIQNYIKNGTYNKRIEYAKKTGNNNSKLPSFKMLPDTSSKGFGLFGNLPSAYSHYMPSTGNVNMALFMVEFSDMTFSAGAYDVYNILMNDELNTNQKYPYDSLKAYYMRSSYGQLNINTDIYKCSIPMTRDDYSASFFNVENPTIDPFVAMLEDIMVRMDATVDFSKYDNYKDGLIDGLSFVWKGPNGGWGSIWWSQMGDCSGYTSDRTYDGAELAVFTWLSADTHLMANSDARVAIHETGHLIGLPDYYDYDEYYGPDGGTGHMDMMDGNRGDHNSFSKYLLGWITPTVVTGNQTVNLKAIADTSQLLSNETRAVIVAKDSAATNFSEYYLIEYRKPIENDSASSGFNGVAIWHVKAEVSNGEFENDNSTSSYKLLTLVEADGLEGIENGGAFYSGMLYGVGKTFGVNTFPTSDKYGGQFTGLNITVDSFTGNNANVTIIFTNDTQAPVRTDDFARITPTMSATAACIEFSTDVYVNDNTKVKFTTSDGVSIGGFARTYKNNAYFLPQKQLLPSETYTLTVEAGALRDSIGNISTEASLNFTTTESGGVDTETIRVINTPGYIGECSVSMDDGKMLSASFDNSSNLILTKTDNGEFIESKTFDLYYPIYFIKSFTALKENNIIVGYLLTYNFGPNFAVVKFDTNLDICGYNAFGGENISNAFELGSFYYLIGTQNVLQYNTDLSLNNVTPFYNDFSYINSGILTSDGNILVVGEDVQGEMLVIKMDCTLTEIWRHTENYSSKGMSVTETDGSYAVLKLANFVYNKAVFEAQAYITKISSDKSSVTTSSSIGTTVFTEYRIPQIKSDFSGSLYVSLYTNRSVVKPYCYRTNTGYYVKGFDSEVIKLDSQNNIMWRRCLPGGVALGTSPMLVDGDKLIMTGYDEENDCLLLYVLKDFESPEIIERYVINEGGTTKAFTSVKNIKAEGISPLLAIGVFDADNNQVERVVNTAENAEQGATQSLSVQYSGALDRKVYLFDDTKTIKPLYFGGVICPAD